MKKKKKLSDLYEQSVNVLNLPKDVLLGQPVVSIVGFREIYIENYRYIQKFKTNEIKIRTKHGSIHFYGQQISIDFYTKEEIKISGYIEHIDYNANWEVKD